MLVERVEPQWIDAFARVLELCKVARGDAVAVLSERQSRAVNVELASLAAARLGARWFHLQLATPAQVAPVPVRSTGASAVLGAHPAVACCAVVARPDPRWGEVPVAFVALRQGATLSRADALALFDGRLARFKHPRDVVFVDQLPITALGKVEKFRLRALLARG